MARKSTAAVQKPVTVAERRRAIRNARAPASGPTVRKTEIDLTKPAARKALTALYPQPENETIIAATPALEKAALEYVEARDQEKLAKERKEVAGNILCAAIRKNLGVAGEGWKAVWDMSKGSVDWTQLAKDLAIADDVIAKYRKPPTRGLDVDELADKG